MTTQRDFKACYAGMLNTLRGAQGDRDLRSEVSDTGEIGWAVWERYAMWGQVNRWRTIRKKAHVPLSRVISKENMASGHVDYTHKFALYCAELVFEEAEKR